MAAMSNPPATRYFEDLPVGLSVDLGTASFSEADIIDFARVWDPQSFHVDPLAALSSPFGGLVASGIHTLAAFMRLYVTRVLLDAASLGSPGVEEVRWPAPVRAGDTIRASYSVLDARPSTSRPDRGIVIGAGTASNQDGQPVLALRVVNFLGRRGRPDAAS